MIEIGAIGSPIDAATFVAVLVMLRYEIRADLGKVAAAVVALAREHRGVDHEQLRADLDVPEHEIDAIRPTILDGGGEDSE